MAEPTHRKPGPRPAHYKVICASLYVADLERADELVAELKRRGWTKASRSELIRIALAQLDIDKLPVRANGAQSIPALQAGIDAMRKVG